jgi:hypothetical protein
VHDLMRAARRAHGVASVVAALCIASFFCATLFTEAFGSHDAVARLKSLIVMPGLLILVPTIAITGGSGFFLSRSRRGWLMDAKKKRMPFIAANGLLILVPCAIMLDRWAAAGSFSTAFIAVQALELAAGATNLVLMGLNVRDGLPMSGRLRTALAKKPWRGADRRSGARRRRPSSLPVMNHLGDTLPSEVVVVPPARTSRSSTSAFGQPGSLGSVRWSPGLNGRDGSRARVALRQDQSFDPRFRPPPFPATAAETFGGTVARSTRSRDTLNGPEWPGAAGKSTKAASCC